MGIQEKNFKVLKEGILALQKENEELKKQLEHKDTLLNEYAETITEQMKILAG